MSKAQQLASGFSKVRSLPNSRKKEVPEAQADRFVEAGEVNEAEADRSQKKDTPLRRKTKGKRLNMYLPDDLVLKLRQRCVLEERSLSDAVEEAVRVWMGLS